MKSTNKSFMLELAYRLNVLYNVAGLNRGTPPWIDEWIVDANACVQNWKRSLFSVNASEKVDIRQNMIIKNLQEIGTGLSGNHSDAMVYKHMLILLMGIADLVESPTNVFHRIFNFGQQLGLSDLMSIPLYKPSMKVQASSKISNDVKIEINNAISGVKAQTSPPGKTLANEPSETSVERAKHSDELTLFKDFFPKTVTKDFREKVVHLFNHKNLFVDKSETFSPGGWVRLILALWSPDLYPSILWLVPDPESPKRSYLIAVGKIPLRASVIHLKDSNDQALKKLAVQMKRDKAAGQDEPDCGWVTCQGGLWESNQRGTLYSARKNLSELAASLGELEYASDRKTNDPHHGKMRLPMAWASKKSIVFISALR